MSKQKININPTNVKRILFNVKFKGQGVVNFDESSLQIEKMKKVDGWYKNLFIDGKIKKNILLAKKVFQKIEPTEDNESPYAPEYTFKLMVSRNAIMHDMYRDVDMAKSASIMNNPTELYLDITSSESLMRGYMYAPKNDGNSKNLTIKKKGAVTLVDAIQSCDAATNLSLGINHKEKLDSEKDENNKKDTSMFSRETVGDIKYESNGNFINISQLEFVPSMAETDRVSFNPDLRDKWKESFDINFMADNLNSNKDITQGNFKLATSKSELKEFGLLLSKDAVNHLIRDFFNRLIRLRINRSGATMEVEEIEVCFENDNLEVDSENTKEFFTLTRSDIHQLNIDYVSAYKFVDDELPVQEPKTVVVKAKKGKKTSEAV